MCSRARCPACRTAASVGWDRNTSETCDGSGKNVPAADDPWDAAPPPASGGFVDEPPS